MLTRGQIEWAIAQVTDQTQGPGGEPGHELRMKLKRLLDLDRKKGVNATKPWPEFCRFAFLEGGLPGKGFAIAYTRYDAFALLLGLRLLDNNVPQMAVIRVLRRVRLDLQAEFERILRISPDLLAQSNQGVEGKIKAGLLVQDPAEMVFFALPSGAGAEAFYRRQRDGKLELANIAHSPRELVKFITHLTLVSPPALVFELVNPAHQLAWWLERAPLIRRGRS
jgi:hypothetical protein